ncbi:hypothetical protein PFFVO_05960, partial [Plasmodium falciparum Vietnam Oak-Knoll (FVO)]
MAPVRGGGGNDYSDAKDFLDKIGQQVYDEVKNGEAKTYKDELKGKLSLASTSSETNSTENPCDFEYTEHTTSAKGNTKPCGNDGNVERFPDKEGAECANNRIEGNNKASNGKDFGACAPYRRLSLCNKNLEYINRYDSSKAKHDLLAEVCMAAKFEAQSLIRYHPQYQAKYPDSNSQICTVLARSFADIGDIVRGKDLYLGKKKKNQNGKETEREKLEKSLKNIFKKIYEGLTTENGVKARYQNDTGDFFKLREDWWTANRETVWKALTCDVDGSYFRATCSDLNGSFSQAKDKCRCNDDKKPGKPKAGDGDVTIVPTYFDYVPQYLRWFEEWAEDFCRKKKKYVNIVKKFCREGENGEEKYCSRNGYDCTKTKPAIGKYRMGNQCTKCLFACNPYVEWIEKQKEQFDKQKEKYPIEIRKYESGASGSSRRQKRGVGGTTNYDGYEKKFYNKLKDDGNYSDVDKFLDLLSKEDVCKKVEDDKGGKIDFKEVNSASSTSGRTAVSDTSGTNDKEKGTFYRSKYCQPCPWCGMKRTKNGGNKWEEKSADHNCTRGKRYKPNEDAKPTEITILKSGENHDDIKGKIEQFCKTQNGSDGGGSGVAGGS